MTSNKQSLQERFLGDLKDKSIPVSIFLVNGIKLQGKVASYDDKVIVLKNNITQMVYRHAISTVVPNKSSANFNLFPDSAEKENSIDDSGVSN